MLQSVMQFSKGDASYMNLLKSIPWILLTTDCTIDGTPVERSINQYPYSYTRFCIYNNGWRPGDSVAWSDRLSQQYVTYRELKKNYLGDGDCYSSYDPKAIEVFLCALFGYDIILTGIEQECNALTGYPYWLFYFRKKD